MEAKELRIGNYFIDYETEPEKTIYWKVEEICKFNLSHKLGVRYRNGSSWNSAPEPIPITEEILLKCGFERNDDLFELDCYYSRFYWVKEKRVIIFNQKNSVSINIQYLHQLQNLYFALTGQELEFNI